MTARAALLDLPGEILEQLSPRAVAIYVFIVEFLGECGYPPSVREIGMHVGLESTSSVHHQLRKLQALGLVRREPGHSRALTLPVVDARDVADVADAEEAA